MNDGTPKDVLSIFEQAHSYQENENWADAIILYTNIVKLNPSMMEAHHNLAICFRKNGNH